MFTTTGYIGMVSGINTNGIATLVIGNGAYVNVPQDDLRPVRRVVTSQECPYCRRVMSMREAQEQGACNDCGDKD